ncbi:MAG: hypothetical protein DMF62_00450 [Acidobacteria bacterium]|nr:MAG: hypothetical protein DMF62_00450 [Acidobacteriota bacterium]
MGRGSEVTAMKTKQKLASITGAGREVIECRKEEDSEKAKAWPDTPAQSATLANSMKTKKTERSAVNAVEAAHNYRQHAQCLADALKLLLADRPRLQQRPTLGGCAARYAGGFAVTGNPSLRRDTTRAMGRGSEVTAMKMGKGGENVGQLRLSDRLANVPRLRFASDGRSHHLRQSRMQRGKQAMKLATIVFLSLTVAAVLCWSALHVAQSIARAETSKITHIEREIDQ